MEQRLTREEFECLVPFATKEEGAKREGLVYQTLVEKGYIGSNGITAKGKMVLEPYRAKRAIFIAAGTGIRLRPITVNTPKPLVRVNGVRIIDTLIDAILSAGIQEIYIVRGHLGEQFDQLLLKYPMLKFLDNQHYNTENNISSLMCARLLLQNTYILEADLLLKNPDVITPYHYSSDYLGIEMEKTDDWCFLTQNGIIRDWKIGGTNCYQEVGISYWSAEDGERLKNHIEMVYERPEGKNLFWDHVPLVDFRDEYQVGIRECSEKDVVEIDTFLDLKAIDQNYNI